MTHHLLQVPGSRPIEFDVPDEPDDGARSCGSCGATRRAVPVLGGGYLLHDAECSVAKGMVARQNRDITTDGAAEFIEALKLDLARQFSDEVLGTEEDHVDSPLESARRRDLIAGHLAGYKKAERAARKFLQGGVSRLASDLKIWDGVSIEDDDDASPESR